MRAQARHRPHPPPPLTPNIEPPDVHAAKVQASKGVSLQVDIALGRGGRHQQGRRSEQPHEPHCRELSSRRASARSLRVPLRARVTGVFAAMQPLPVRLATAGKGQQALPRGAAAGPRAACGKVPPLEKRAFRRTAQLRTASYLPQTVFTSTNSSVSQSTHSMKKFGQSSSSLLGTDNACMQSSPDSAAGFYRHAAHVWHWWFGPGEAAKSL